jgi:hypothetical protein
MFVGARYDAPLAGNVRVIVGGGVPLATRIISST